MGKVFEACLSSGCQEWDGVGLSVSSSAAQLEMDIVLGHVAAGCFQSFHECLSPGKGMGHGEVNGGEWGT
jgi:hypothetical protein